MSDESKRALDKKVAMAPCVPIALPMFTTASGMSNDQPDHEFCMVFAVSIFPADSRCEVPNNFFWLSSNDSEEIITQVGELLRKSFKQHKQQTSLVQPASAAQLTAVEGGRRVR